ncbi:hypothetical protein SLS62_009443 [Diatrype stigma]|uniref:15-hydroxyprostaglandin dehydrogenase n=1 Tax=Diatrype stigma TaxID=117547 RepID=A0AAN9UED4_9PEZI
MAEIPQKVALVTGGGSGIGQAVVQALVARGGWSVHIIDVKDDIGPLSPNTFYHKADTTNYGQLTAAFKETWAAGGKRLDFLFANAGILEKTNWFAKSESPDEPPEEPQWDAMEINLKGCMNTVRIGRHYMAQNPDGGSIVVTSSSAAIWPSFCSPIYTSSKHGVLGFVRSVEDWYYTSDKIRINTLCPSAVRTAIVSEQGWAGFPPSCFTPFEVVTEVVLKFLDGECIVDSAGVKADKNYGQTIVPTADKFYHNFMPPFCDERHRSMVEATHVENMIGHIL